MRKLTVILTIWAALLGVWGGELFAQVPNVKVKDYTKVDGATDNELEGIGLVVGLEGTGDGDIPVQQELLRNYMNRFFPQLDIQPDDIAGPNTALVDIQATLTAFQKSNTNIDVKVSSIGQAESLRGGRLLSTFLRGPNQNIYAVAKGDLTLSGNHTTTAKIPNGARVIREVSNQWIQEKKVRGAANQPMQRRYIKLNLKKPNWNAARQIAGELRRQLVPSLRAWVSLLPDEQNVAVAHDRSTIFVQLPLKEAKQEAKKRGESEMVKSDVAMLSDILEVPIQPNEQTGVMLKSPQVIINENDQSWSIQGNVMVSPATVRVPGIDVLDIDQPRSMEAFLQQAVQQGGLTNQQVITIIKSLDNADAIQGKVMVR